MGWFGSLFHFIGKIPGGDQTGHFCLMGFFGFMACWLFGGRFLKFWKLKVPWGSVVVVILVTIEEFSQILIANRSFDLADLAADFAGITLFSLIWYRLVYIRSKKKYMNLG